MRGAAVFLMTHQDVVDRGIVESYLSSRLTAEDRSAFEEHFFECDDCFAAVEVDDRVRSSVRHLAATGDLAPASGGGRTPPARGWTSPVRTWLPVAAMFIIAVWGAWVVSSERALRQRLEEADARTAGLEQAIAALNRPAAATLASAAPADGPEGNVPLAILQTTRDTNAAATALVLPTGARRFIVWLEDVPSADGQAFEAVLTSPAGASEVRVDGLRPNQYGAIVAVFPASAVANGTHLLTVSTLGSSTPVVRYALTITRR